MTVGRNLSALIETTGMNTLDMFLRNPSGNEFGVVASAKIHHGEIL